MQSFPMDIDFLVVNATIPVTDLAEVRNMALPLEYIGKLFNVAPETYPWIK